MREYNPNALYSFRYNNKPKQEIKMKRVWFRKGKKIVDSFYAERTSDPNKIVVPDSIICNIKDNNPHGFLGDIKEGDYLLGNCKVRLVNAEQVFGGLGIVTVLEN